jgi:hypothetical protein
VPGGGRWSVTGDVRSNGGCSYWLLRVSFVPFGSAPGSWSGAWAIPARGHLPDRFTIFAKDQGGGTQGAASGIVGIRTTEIELYVGPGKRKITVHPILPSLSGRKRFPWLRNFRYFVRFLPASSPVREVKLINSDGEVFFSEKPFEGDFEGQR